MTFGRIKLREAAGAFREFAKLLFEPAARKGADRLLRSPLVATPVSSLGPRHQVDQKQSQARGSDGGVHGIMRPVPFSAGAFRKFGGAGDIAAFRRRVEGAVLKDIQVPRLAKYMRNPFQLVVDALKVLIVDDRLEELKRRPQAPQSDPALMDGLDPVGALESLRIDAEIVKACVAGELESLGARHPLGEIGRARLERMSPSAMSQKVASFRLADKIKSDRRGGAKSARQLEKRRPLPAFELQLQFDERNERAFASDFAAIQRRLDLASLQIQRGSFSLDFNVEVPAQAPTHVRLSDEAGQRRGVERVEIGCVAFHPGFEFVSFERRGLLALYRLLFVMAVVANAQGRSVTP